MLDIKHLKKTYENTEVLKDISLHVNRGDVTAVIGPSGSGKTTLLRCLNFLTPADSGTLTFGGRTFDLSRMSGKDIAAIRMQTGFVFQSFNLFANKTAIQNVTEGLVIARHMKKAEANAIAMQALERVGLKDRASHYPSQLSGGQQQRVAIARALVTRPTLLLADEPTGALDQKTGRQVMGLFRELNDEGRTIIMITHDMNIAKYARRVVHIIDGVLTEGGGTADA